MRVGNTSPLSTGLWVSVCSLPTGFSHAWLLRHSHRESRAESAALVRWIGSHHLPSLTLLLFLVESPNFCVGWTEGWRGALGSHSKVHCLSFFQPPPSLPPTPQLYRNRKQKMQMLEIWKKKKKNLIAGIVCQVRKCPSPQLLPDPLNIPCYILSSAGVEALLLHLIVRAVGSSAVCEVV